MRTAKTVALIVIIISIAVGTIFGLLVQSSTPLSQHISFAASIAYAPSGISCAKVGNYSDWLQIFVTGNRTGLNLNTVTIYDSGTLITLTMPLNATMSPFVSYYAYNSTYEIISVPLPNYWKAQQDLDVSLSYTPSGLAPVAYSVGETPIVQRGNMTC